MWITITNSDTNKTDDINMAEVERAQGIGESHLILYFKSGAFADIKGKEGVAVIREALKRQQDLTSTDVTE